MLVAIGVGADGYRILGVAESHKEDKSGWSGFLRHLKERGLTGIKLIISDACLGLKESIHDYYPEAQWQRRMVHFLPQRLQPCAQRQGEGSGSDAQSDPCAVELH